MSGQGCSAEISFFLCDRPQGQTCIHAAVALCSIAILLGEHLSNFASSMYGSCKAQSSLTTVSYLQQHILTSPQPSMLQALQQSSVHCNGNGSFYYVPSIQRLRLQICLLSFQHVSAWKSSPCTKAAGFPSCSLEAMELHEASQRCTSHGGLARINQPALLKCILC